MLAAGQAFRCRVVRPSLQSQQPSKEFRCAMKLPIRTLVSAAAVLSVFAASQACAADQTAVKASPANKVAGCATPGRLMAFIKSRNDKLDPRFDGIATEYMRHGEELGMRWDVAFFQMVVETGNLKFGGDVKPAQNNFAGLGATGNGERGESFKDVTTGVRAHLEHLLMYTGEKIANPVAERTRKVQEWGVLTEWQKTIKGPLTFAQLARKWAPPARKYAQEIEQVGESFTEGPCKSADPHPELIAAARSGKPETLGKPLPHDVAVSTPASDKPSGTDLAKRANDDARAEGGKRATLGAAAVAKSATLNEGDTKAEPKTFALLNPPKPEDQPSAAQSEKPVKASASAIAKGAKPAPPAAPVSSACKVFTASYGGAKAIIIKAAAGDGVNYTVLDVNEGSEAREADAYIAAYAPGGKQVGEFKSQNQALDKAFELCPEG
jgi:hypothetical protein